MNSKRHSHANAEGKEQLQDDNNTRKSYKPEHLFSEPDDVEDLGNQNTQPQGYEKIAKNRNHKNENQQYHKQHDSNRFDDHWNETKQRNDRNVDSSYQNYPRKQHNEGYRKKVNAGKDQYTERQTDNTEWHGKRNQRQPDYEQRHDHRQQDNKYVNEGASHYSKYKEKGNDYRNPNQNTNKESYKRGRQTDNYHGYERDNQKPRQKDILSQGKEVYAYQNQKFYQKGERDEYRVDKANNRQNKQQKYEEQPERSRPDQFNQKPKDNSSIPEYRPNKGNTKQTPLSINLLVVDSHFKALIAKLRKFGVNTYSTSQLPINLSQSKAVLITNSNSPKLDTKAYNDVYQLREGGDDTVQFLELISRYNLKLNKDEFMSRCINCNSTSFDLVPPTDAKAYEALMAKAPSSHADMVWQCHSCKIPYYEGCRPLGL